MAIYYFEEAVQSRLKNKRRLNAFLKKKIEEYRPVKKVNLNFIFCDDAFLLEKNINFLNHDTYTDIITFDLSESSDVLDAEIYISIERVAENATNMKIPYQEELHRVIFHGVLHLCGFKDKTEKEQSIMRMKEQECLQQYTEI